jgi:endonuclease/exonuclease/phosphatase family metal-dependent hydrolase
LKLASWNLEWLIAPAAFKPLKGGCAPEGSPIMGDVRRLPCDVVHRLERSSRDFAALARYARVLDADVIALQEVDGPEAARLVFPGYDFCFTGRRHVQNNGFAVRSGIPHRCAPDWMSLSRGDSLRRGAELILFPGESREIRLLSIHLKSGCSDRALDGGDKACGVLARQVPALESWIDRQAGAQRRFGVLGDFNRDFRADRGEARSAAGQLLHLWPELDDGVPPGARLRDAAAGQPFRNCAPGQGYGAYIDHLVLSASLAAHLMPRSFQRVSYSAADARRARLSDHCPIAVRVRIEQIASERSG